MSEPSPQNTWGADLPELQRRGLLEDLARIEYEIVQQQQEPSDRRKAIAAIRAAEQTKSLLERWKRRGERFG